MKVIRVCEMFPKPLRVIPNIASQKNLRKGPALFLMHMCVSVCVCVCVCVSHASLSVCTYAQPIALRQKGSHS